MQYNGLTKYIKHRTLNWIKVNQFLFELGKL